MHRILHDDDQALVQILHGDDQALVQILHDDDQALVQILCGGVDACHLKKYAFYVHVSIPR